VVAPPWTGSTVGKPAESKGVEPAKVEFPKAAGWDVTLSAAGKAATLSGSVSGVAVDPSKLPVRITGTTEGAAGQKLHLEVRDRNAAQQLGVSGFVFAVSDIPGDATPGALGRGAVPATITVDYAGFAEAYGADYPSRLRVMALPDCALSTPVPAGCDLRGTALPTRTDYASKTVSVDVTDLSTLAAPVDKQTPSLEPGSVFPLGRASQAAPAQATAVLAVTSSVGGEFGTYAVPAVSA
jgi:hypothetical protein